jgi:mRNA interferase HigB
VTIAGRQLIEKFIRKHANSKSSLSAWLEDAEEAEWKTPQDIKDRYRSADFLSGNRVIFDIGGNNYRLMVLVRYRNGMLLIQKIGTHAEYSKWKLT